MKDWEYNVTLILSVGCLVLAIWIIGVGRANEKLQARLQLQQVDIERGNVSRQVGNRIVQDMVTAGATNSAIRMIMEKYGFVQSRPASPVNAKNDRQAPLPVKARTPKNTAAGK